MFDEKLISTMRRGSYIVNTARAEETVPEAIADALSSGRLAGYAGALSYQKQSWACGFVVDSAMGGR